MIEQPYLMLDQIDAQWCLKQGREIVSTLPMFERSNTSGKFYRNYECWHFYRDSQNPLIQEFMRLCERHRAHFESVYQRPLQIDYVILGYTQDSSQEMCIDHKDGFYFDGQMHLTLLGNAHIRVLAEDNQPELIHVPNGSFWYLNSSRYVHKIVPTQGERFELCAAVSYRRDLVEKLKSAVVDAPSRHLELRDPSLIEYRKKLIADQIRATKEGRASSHTVADFSHHVDEVDLPPRVL